MNTVSQHTLRTRRTSAPTTTATFAAPLLRAARCTRWPATVRAVLSCTASAVSHTAQTLSKMRCESRKAATNGNTPGVSHRAKSGAQRHRVRPPAHAHRLSHCTPASSRPLRIRRKCGAPIKTRQQAATTVVRMDRWKMPCARQNPATTGNDVAAKSRPRHGGRRRGGAHPWSPEGIKFRVVIYKHLLQT